MGSLDDVDSPVRGEFQDPDDPDDYEGMNPAQVQARQALIDDLLRNSHQPQDRQTLQGSEFLRRQKSQMGEAISHPPEVLEAYNISVLGSGYREREAFDVIIQDDVKIGEYLDESPDNLVFLVGSDVFFSERSRVTGLMPVYECQRANSMAAFTDNVYINVTNLGAPFVGVADYGAFKTLVINSNYQVFRLRHTGRNTGPLATYRVRHLGGSWVGDSHCQAGSDVPYYATYIPCTPKEV
jgi:hypothetical protein